MKRISFIIVYFLTYLIAQNANMPQSVLSSGVIDSESEQTKLVGTVGQVFTHKVISTSTVLISGFWGSLTQITLGVDDLLPEDFSISTAYPNPFNPSTKIDFILENQNEINMAIFNVNGQLIQTLKSGIQPAGAHSVVWNGRNTLGELVGSGVYIYSLSTPEKTVSKRLIFLK